MLQLSKHTFYALFLVLILSSCGLKHEEKINRKEVGRSIFEARWSDVPLPIDRIFDVKKTYQALDQSACRFVFTSQHSYIDMAHWYESELERSGWRINAQYQFDGSVAILADRPSKFLHIYIQKLSSDKTRSSILVGLKR